VIFFSHTINGVVAQLGDMKAIDHSCRVGQELRTRFVVGRSHVHAIAPHLGTLRRCQTLQTLEGGRLVTSGHDREYFRLPWPRQVRQDGHVHFMPLFQTDLIHAEVGDHPRGIQHLGGAHLLLDDPRHRFRRDTQAPGDFGFGAADQQPHHILFKTIGIARVLAFEGRNQILAMMTALTAVKGRRIGPITGLAANIQVTNDACLAGGFPVGLFFMATALTAPLRGPSPIDLEAMGFALAFVTGDGNALGQIKIDGNIRHGRSWQ
jgi:hypothetical protein